MQTLKLTEGQKKVDFTLKLTPTGAILGRVVDANGEPMENAMVSAGNGPIPPPWR